MKKAVKNLIKGEDESKYLAEFMVVPGTPGSALSTYTGFSRGITSVQEIYACLPELNQGVGSFQRIGDRITPTSCYVDLDICGTTAQNLMSIDRTVHVYMLSCVAVKSLDNYTSIPMDFLEDGVGTQVQFDGTVQRSRFPVDRSTFKVHHHKAINLKKAWGKLNGNSSIFPGDPNQTGDSCVSMSSVHKYLRLKVPLPKVLKYDNASATYPMNSAPFMVIGWVYNDASGDHTDSAVDLQVISRVSLHYTDC